MSKRIGILGLTAGLFVVGGAAHSGGAWRMANELFVPKPEILPAANAPSDDVDELALVSALSSLPLSARVAAMRALPKQDMARVLVSMEPDVAQETAMALAITPDQPVAP